MLTNLPTAVFLLVTTITLPTYAGIQQSDFSGIGRIHVLASSDWSTATPNNTVGCLDDSGKFVADDGSNNCGTFSRLDDYPYTLSSKTGNCTFEDSTQEENTDSYYGKGDYAWHCKTKHKSDIYDELYTIVSALLLLSPSKPPRITTYDTDRVSEWLPIRLPLLRRHCMLLRCQTHAQWYRSAVAMAVPLGLAANGHHAGTRHAAAHVGKDRGAAEEKGCKWGSWAASRAQ
jgi:hypothetical protein